MASNTNTSLRPTLPLGSASPAPSSPVANVQIDPDGDVVLVVKNDKGTARFQVNSSVLCFCSPVFREMLCPKGQLKDPEVKDLPCSRKPGKAPLEVSLPDDDPNVLAVVLRILHCQYDLVPKTITTNRLYKLAITCDRYDVREALCCWLEKWIPGPHKFPGFTMLPGGQLDKGLFIAYVFRMEEAFQSMSLEIIRTYKGTTTFERIAAPEFEYVPKEIVDAIMSARTAAIKAMLSSITRHLKRYEDTTRVRCHHGKVSCDTFMLGHIMREFRRTGLCLEEPAIRKKSVTAIKGMIDKLEPPQSPYFDKAAGCCDKPARCQCEGETCVNCKFKGCTECKRPYKSAQEISHNFCSPTTTIMKEAEGIVAKIEGLQWSQWSRFVEMTTGGEAFVTKVPSKVDLWNCLKYI